MKLAAGVTIKNYILDEMIGLGAAGEVWKAHDESKTVAIKLMNPKLLQGEGSDKHRLRMQREVEALTRLQHPNVPTLYDYDLDFERPYLVMRFIGGDTYDKLIARGQMMKIGIDQRLHMISELAQALSAAHALGIIHRDIKPANMIGIENPYLLDFGIALKVENLEMTMRNVGTALYMAPEDPPDELSDNFSFALVTYEILFGTHAIFIRDNTGNQHFAVYTRYLAGERIKNGEWRIPSKVPETELPPDLRNADLNKLDAIFARALGERGERYVDLRQFVDELKSAIPTGSPGESSSTAYDVTAEVPVVSAPPGEDHFTMIQATDEDGQANPTSDQPKKRLDPRLLIAGAVVVIVIVVLLLLLMSRG